MADQQHGARVILQQRFEQFQRVDVEVVGGLVEHQHVRRLAEQSRQQQAIAFAAGQRFHRRPRAFRWKQEVAEVGHDVLARAVDLDKIGTGRDGLRNRALFIELHTKLVVVGHRQFGAAAHLAGIGLHLAEDEFDQRGLAGAVRTDQADLVAAQYAAGKILDDLALAQAFVDVLEFRHELPRALALRHGNGNLAESLPPCRAFQAQAFEPAHAAFVARAPRLDALADPHLFLRQQLVELLVVHRFHRELLGLALFVCGEAAGIKTQPAAIEFGNGGDGAVEEGAVMGHDKHRAGKVGHHVFQPDDRFHVEVIGRLVEYQQLRIARQRARQGHAFAQAAGQRIDARVLLQAEARQHGFDAVLDLPAVVLFEQFLRGLHAVHRLLVAGGEFRCVRSRMIVGQDAGKVAESRDCGFEHRMCGIEFGLLHHVGNAQARLPPDPTVIGHRHPGQQLEHARLARSVAPDQPDATPRLDHQVDVIQQGHMAIGERNVFESGERHGKGANGVGTCGGILRALGRIKGTRSKAGLRTQRKSETQDG